MRSAAYLVILLLGIATLAAADSVKPLSAVGGVEAKVAPAAAAVAEKPASLTPRQKCIARCEADNGRCNSEVRRSRQECSRKAANNGNNPMTGRPEDGYCGYFQADQCGYYSGSRGACGQRFARRYAECTEWMRGSISSQRFDCFKAETKAQGLCRAELQDCQVECR